MKKFFDKIKSIISSYLNFDGAIDEAIVMITVVFILVILVLIFYVFITKKDIQPNNLTLVETIWGSTVTVYIAKAVVKVIDRIKNKKN